MKIKKIIISLFLAAGIILPMSTAMAQGGGPLISTESLGQQTNQEAAFIQAAGLDMSASVGGIASNIIKAVLSLLGIAFLSLMVYAGYLWMRAQGNEELVSKAKDTIKAAIIGLIIVTAAYSITSFVFNSLGSATGSSGGGNKPAGTTAEPK